MALRIRILLWVSSLFLSAIIFIFVTSYFEINSSLQREEESLVNKVKQFDYKNTKNIQDYLSLHINDEAQKMYSVFEMLKTSPQWRQRFLPNDYTLRTKNWGSSAAVLATYPWLDFINVQINENLTAFIRQANPYLNKFVKIPVGEDLTLFTTKSEDGQLVALIGVPFWGNKAVSKYLKGKVPQEFFLTDQPDQWILYEVDDLLTLDPTALHPAKNQIYRHLFDEAITVHSQKEYDFIVLSLKTMLSVIKQKVIANPDLIKILHDPNKLQEFLKRELTIIKPDIEFERNFCDSPFCKYATKHHQEGEWTTRRNFSHKFTQQKMIWQLGMVIRTGLWNFSPWAKGMPKGIVTALAPTRSDKKAFFDNVTEGFFIKNVFLDKTIIVPRECKLSTDNPEYDKEILFHGSKKGVAKSCRNHNLGVYYDSDLKEPYITSTHYITFLEPPMKEPNEASITLGIALDPILISLSLVSPDAVAFIYGNGDIRFYSTKGEVSKIVNDNDENRLKLITHKEGSLITKDGKKLYFRNLGEITDNGGSIVIIEQQESRTSIIDAIGSHIKALSRRVTIHSSILILCALIIMMFILSRVINAITKPINKLAEITGSITDRKLNEVEIDPKYAQRNDEIGSLYSSFDSMITSMKEGTKVRGLLDKVVSKQVAEKILREGVALGGELRTLTVMFCDIRNFTSITEKMNPENVIIMLNECLTLLSAIIDDFEGVIDKYEGDKIMTLFGAPITTEDHALQAALCAIEMQNALNIWNLTREASGFCKLEVGIGIHTGEAVAGNVGAENHLSYTVLGHIVNLSARLCDGAKAQEILITKETLDLISDFVEVRQNPPHKFKGISEPVTTYSIIRKK